MQNRSKPEVVVTGAGPVGLFAALCLAKQGVKVRIFEEEWRSTTHSYALALHAGTLELLDSVGLGAHVLERARRIQTIGVYDARERRAKLSLGELNAKYPFVAVLPQADFEGMLIDALAKRGVEVEWNHRLARITPTQSGVDLVVDKLGKEPMGYVVAHTETVVEDSMNLSTPWLLAADGHESVVRTQLRIDFDEVRPAAHFAVFEFQAIGDVPNEVSVVLTDDSTNVLWPMPGGRCRWSFQLPNGKSAPADSRDKDRRFMHRGWSLPYLEESRLRELVAERAPWFKAEIGEIHWRMAVGFEHCLASSYGKAHAWLAGEAAHMTGPVGAQSMNVGLREAASLAEIYAELIHGKASPEALQSYQQGYLGEWGRLLGLGGAHLTADGAEPWVAERAERLVPCIPASGEHFAALASQLGLEPG